MRIRFSRQTNQGLTLIEAVVVIFILAFIAMLLVPALLAPRYNYGPRLRCTNNLKQTALAIKVWAGDHNDKYPMAVSVTNGGAMELMETPDAWKIFQMMSNELGTPKVIYCPADLAHGTCATNFTDDLKNKISYFIGADATDANPQTLLSGDDNFLLNQSPVHPGLVTVTSPAQLEWDGDRHGSVTDQGWFNKPKKLGSGNIALTDGSVQGVTPIGLTNLVYNTGLATNRLVIP
ncbi:MAG TPA: prepilin-type N-terminal cleavage/methylation domain-containing protein [Candidatus Acidoferrales bacterium]|nr:prepilin-type N-terminal cleavage/methylation domain-containing protein [Candidatus Acidoferrales bacterium]